jgi:undecaprenyl-diphosphatase
MDSSFSDVSVSAWFYAHQQPVLTQFMLLITHWHSILGVSVMTAALSVRLYLRQQHHWLRLLILSVVGGMLLNAGLKQVFQRPRPQFEDPLVTLASYSFPSGHTAATTLFYGFLVLLLLRRPGQSALRRSAIVVGAVVMVLLVATSRVYLGAHYLSDVLAAMLEGVLWLALCVAFLRRFPRHRADTETANAPD